MGSPPAGSRSAKKTDDTKPASDVISDGDGHTADPPKRWWSAKWGGEDQKQGGDGLSDGDGGHAGADNPRLAAPDQCRATKSSAKVNLLSKLCEPLVQVAQPACEDENAMFPDVPLFSPRAARDDALTSVDLHHPGDPSWANNNSPGDSQDPRPPPDPSPDNSPLGKEKTRDWREVERTTDMRRLVDCATKGFSQQSARLVTLARLSLMLGKTDHVRLEYDWRPKWPSAGGVAAPAGIAGEVERLTNMLRRLSNLANLEYRDLMQKALSFLAPRKRKPKRKPVVCQRTLLPKMQNTPLILVPQNILQPLSGASTPVQSEPVRPGLLQTVQPVTQQTEVAMDDAAVSAVITTVSSSVIPGSSTAVTNVVSSAVMSLSSTVSSGHPQLEVDIGTTAVSLSSLKGDNSVSSSDLFPGSLDLPVVVSPDSSPHKSTQQLISSSVSPPSLSSIFDISLPPPSNQAANTGDKFLEMVADGNSGFSVSEIGCDVMMMVRCSLSEIGCDMVMVCCSVSEIGCDVVLVCAAH
ncbi:hypothetical protein ACOMHN_047609 [Nucella lapillus]